MFIWEYRCYVCKKQKADNHVHHLNERHYDNGAHNLLPLCKQCHKMVHKSLKIEKIVFSKEVARQLWLLDEMWKKLE